MAPSRANSEVEEKCSLSRLLSEPFHNGLFLPSNLPAGCSHHLSEGHLAPKPLSSPNHQELHRSLQLPPHRSTAVVWVVWGCRGARSQPHLGLWLPLQGTHQTRRQSLPLAPPSFPGRNQAEKLFKPLQSLAKDRAVFCPDNLNLISKWSL